VPECPISEIKKGRLGLYGAEHSKCNHMMTRGFKELISSSCSAGLNVPLHTV